MSEIISAPVVNSHNEVNTVDKDEDNFDKDSGNHSGEEIDMETKNDLYTKIYAIYEEHRESVKEWSIMPWHKLEPSILDAGASKYER